MAHYLKDCNPCVEDVVKVDRSLKGVDHAIGAVVVVLVPVDARGVVGDVGVHVQVALHASFLKHLGDGGAHPHAVIFLLRADERILIVVFSVVVFVRERSVDKGRSCTR